MPVSPYSDGEPVVAATRRALMRAGYEVSVCLLARKLEHVLVRAQNLDGFAGGINHRLMSTHESLAAADLSRHVHQSGVLELDHDANRGDF